ncbi:MAG: PH domain-containing protein [Myxococcota bacterium]
MIGAEFIIALQLGLAVGSSSTQERAEPEVPVQEGATKDDAVGSSAADSAGISESTGRSESAEPPGPNEAEPSSPTPAEPELDTIEFADGKSLRGRVTRIAEGDYVTVTTPEGPRTVPWTDVRRIRLERGAEDDAIELDLSHASFGPELEASISAPHVEIQTRDGRPISLLRLRNSSAATKERYSTGYDEVCRAPCSRPVEAGSRRFFVDANPWTASKVIEFPADRDRIELLVRPGRVRMRKAGVGLMIAGGAGILVATTILSLPRDEPGPLFGASIGLVSLSCIAVPVGGILFGVSRTKVTLRAKGRSSSAMATMAALARRDRRRW